MKIFRNLHRLLKLVIFAAALAANAEQESAAVKSSPVELTRCKLVFQENSGVGRDALFTAIMPIARGMLYDVSQLRLVDASGKTLRFAGADVIGKWYDDSIALLLLRGQLPVMPNERKEIFVEYGSYVLNNAPGTVLYASSGSRMAISGQDLSCEIDLEKIQLPVNVTIGSRNLGDFSPLFLQGSRPESRWHLMPGPGPQLGISLAGMLQVYFYPASRIKIESTAAASNISGIDFAGNSSPAPVVVATSIRNGRRIKLFDFSGIGTKAVTAELEDPLCGVFTTEYLKSTGWQSAVCSTPLKELKLFSDRQLTRTRKNITALSAAEALAAFTFSNRPEFLAQMVKQLSEAELLSFLRANMAISHEKASCALLDIQQMVNSGKAVDSGKLVQLLDELYRNSFNSPAKDFLQKEFVRFTRFLSYGCCGVCGSFARAVNPDGTPVDGTRCDTGFNIKAGLLLMRAAELDRSSELFAAKSLTVLKRILLDEPAVAEFADTAALANAARRLVNSGILHFSFDETEFLSKQAALNRKVPEFTISGKTVFALNLAGSADIQIPLVRRGAVTPQSSLHLSDSSTGKKFCTVYPGSREFTHTLALPAGTKNRFQLVFNEKVPAVWQIASRSGCTMTAQLTSPLVIHNAQFKAFSLNIPDGMSDFTIRYSGLAGARTILLLTSPDGKRYFSAAHGDFPGTTNSPGITVSKPAAGTWKLALHTAKGDAMLYSNSPEIALEIPAVTGR